MKRFSITKLEEARAKPIEFAKSLKKGDSVPGYGYPKSLRWLNAVVKYHETLNISDAFTSIEDGFRNRQRTAKNRKEEETFMEALDNYKSNINKLNYLIVKSREGIDLNLSRKLKITGQIPLIFMKPEEGFSAFFISKENIQWREELKFPILQHYIGEKVFKTDPQTVDIGYINFYTGEFNFACFANDQLIEAQRELKQIGLQISKYL